MTQQRDQDIKDVVLTDVHNEANPSEPLMSPISERNSTLPCSKEKTFYTIVDNQTSVNFNIYQGEHMYCKNNLYLGEKELNVKKGKRGEFPLKVRFTYDINGILDVDIYDTGTKTQEKLVTSNYNTMSGQAIQASLEELSKFKIHPHENEENKLLLSRLERLYEETTGEERERIMKLSKHFELLLEQQNLIQIEKERETIQQIVEHMEQIYHPHAQKLN